MTIVGERTPGGKEWPGVLIILPVLNEIENTPTLLEGIRAALEGTPYTILYIDDGSKDGTVEFIREAMARYGSSIQLMQRVKRIPGCQRGSALRAGMEWGLQHTDHAVFVEMDGDLSHRPEELRAGITIIKEDIADVAIASKYIPGSHVIRRAWPRRMVSRVCNTAVGAVISYKIRDYSNGYRFYSRQVAQMLAQYAVKYGSPIYLSEVMAIWLKNDLRIVEIPSIYVGRYEGISKLRIIDLVKASLAIFEIGLRYHITGFTKIALPRALASATADCAEASRQ